MDEPSSPFEPSFFTVDGELVVLGGETLNPGMLLGLSIDSLLTILVPWVLGEMGIFPVVALVACDAQSPAAAFDALPSVVSLHRCLTGAVILLSPSRQLNGSLSASSLTAVKGEAVPFACPTASGSEL